MATATAPQSRLEWDVLIDTTDNEPGKGWVLRRALHGTITRDIRPLPDVFVGDPDVPWTIAMDAALAFMDIERSGSFPPFLECDEAKMRWCVSMSWREWRTPQRDRRN